MFQKDNNKNLTIARNIVEKERRIKEMEIKRNEHCIRKVGLYKMKKYDKIKTEYFISQKEEDAKLEKMIEKFKKSKNFNIEMITKFIPGAELYFNCNSRLWQSRVLYQFLL